jgi:hypothetical protein
MMMILLLIVSVLAVVGMAVVMVKAAGEKKRSKSANITIGYTKQKWEL